jgi:hypothetical protein
MNKILIITTEGCEACEIAVKNVDYAIFQTSRVEVESEVNDWHDIKRDFIVKQHIKDFPTVVYMIDERVIHKAIGTYPTAVYLRWIDMYFKN